MVKPGSFYCCFSLVAGGKCPCACAGALLDRQDYKLKKSSSLKTFISFFRTLLNRRLFTKKSMEIKRKSANAQIKQEIIAGIEKSIWDVAWRVDLVSMMGWILRFYDFERHTQYEVKSKLNKSAYACRSRTNI